VERRLAAILVADVIGCSRLSHADFKKVYEGWKPFRKDIDVWFRVAENSFDSFISEKSARGA